MHAGSLDRVDRRLAATLAADAVGDNRVMEPDERGTLERLKTLRARRPLPLRAPRPRLAIASASIARQIRSGACALPGSHSRRRPPAAAD